MDDISDDIRVRLEKEYVKGTYDKIADDFSCTRYKKWPKVDVYLKNLPENSLLLDVGCGNGKYLDNATSYNIGCDISANLLSICKERGFEVIQCDMSRLPFREDIFDSLISVAALHHIVTGKRREECLRKLTNLLDPTGGTMLIQVWAFEQNLDADNPYLKKGEQTSTTTRQVSLDESVAIPVHKNRTQFSSQDLLVPFHTKKASSKESDNSEQLRYYHLFKQDELDSMVKKNHDTSVLSSYYDRGNWCLVVKRYIVS